MTNSNSCNNNSQQFSDCDSVHQKYNILFTSSTFLQFAVTVYSSFYIEIEVHIFLYLEKNQIVKNLFGFSFQFQLLFVKNKKI